MGEEQSHLQSLPDEDVSSKGNSHNTYNKFQKKSSELNEQLTVKKLCILCQQKIDASDYPDHVESCDGSQSISLPSTPRLYHPSRPKLDTVNQNTECTIPKTNRYSKTRNNDHIQISSSKSTDDQNFVEKSTDKKTSSSNEISDVGIKPSVSKDFQPRSKHMQQRPVSSRSVHHTDVADDMISHTSIKLPTNDSLSPRFPARSSSKPNTLKIYQLDDSISSSQSITTTQNSKLSINICSGNLITQQTDVIVVCSSSEYLFNTICKAAGNAVKTSFEEESKKTPKPNVIVVAADGEIVAKKIYFLEWKKNNDQTLLRTSMEKFVADAIEHAVKEKYQSIAFPAIDCGKFGCSITLVAQTMITEAFRQSMKNPISVVFVTQTGRNDIYDEFQKQNQIIQQPQLSQISKTVVTTVGKGTMEVEQGDLTKQNVDIIIGSSSSANLMRAIFDAAGDDIRNAYNAERQTNVHSIFFSIESGRLPCKRIFVLDWNLNENESKLRQLLIDRIWLVMQHAVQYNFHSIAFPALGCGEHGCSTDVVVKTIVKEIKNQLLMRDSPMKIKFVIQPNQQNIYDEFCKQVLTTASENIQVDIGQQLPPTWILSTDNRLRFDVLNTSDEYQSIFTSFHQTINGQYTQILQIERIQNERWYMQYVAHSRDFGKRLKTDTERRLFHGCPETAVHSIIEDCFNRSFAGKNGTAYGVGVYFSSNASYSHGYAAPNEKGERRMFVARVLVGKTTRGNGSMKTRPLGFDSTTDEKHIFVTYHDAQAYAEYLITYK